MLVLVVPPMFLSYARVKEEGKNLAGKYPQLAEIPVRFENSDFFAKKLISEYVSPKEWENAKARVSLARCQNKVQEGFTVDKSVVTKRLAIFNEAITIFLTLLFSLYFFVLFLLLFPPEASPNGWAPIPWFENIPLVFYNKASICRWFLRPI